MNEGIFVPVFTQRARGGAAADILPEPKPMMAEVPARVALRPPEQRAEQGAP